jgi:hypothetical protein
MTAVPDLFSVNSDVCVCVCVRVCVVNVCVHQKELLLLLLLGLFRIIEKSKQLVLISTVAVSCMVEN